MSQAILNQGSFDRYFVVSQNLETAFGADTKQTEEKRNKKLLTKAKIIPLWSLSSRACLLQEK